MKEKYIIRIVESTITLLWITLSYLMIKYGVMTVDRFFYYILATMFIPAPVIEIGEQMIKEFY